MPRTDRASLDHMVVQWAGLDAQAKLIRKRADRLRDQLMEVLEDEGVRDADGHQWIELPEDLVDTTGLRRLKRERRVQQFIDVDKARKLLAERDLWKPVEEGGVLRVEYALDEEALMRKVYERVLTADDLQYMTEEKVTYAFAPQRVRSKK